MMRLAGTWRAIALGLLGTAASFSVVIGAYWDIWWHFNIGRDSFWTLPHIMVYAGVITALVLGTLGALDRRLRPAAIVVGLGGLIVIGAAPIDSVWHAIFGVDFTIWSPPHILIIAGGVVSSIGLVAWWMVQEQLAPSRGGKTRIRLAVTAQVAALLPVVLVLLVEYELALIVRTFLVDRWALQASYYPIFFAFLTFTVAVAVARAIGPAVVVAGSVIAYLLLFAFSLVLRGIQPFAPPVPLFLALIVVAAVILWIPGPAGDIAACLAAVPALYLGMTLGARPVPHDVLSVLGTVTAAVAAAMAGRLLGQALAVVAHASA